jgi:hypothetical protein
MVSRYDYHGVSTLLVLSQLNNIRVTQETAPEAIGRKFSDVNPSLQYKPAPSNARIMELQRKNPPQLKKLSPTLRIGSDSGSCIRKREKSRWQD